MKSHQHIKVRHQWSIMHLHKWKHKKNTVSMLSLPPCIQTDTHSPSVVTVMIQAEIFHARRNTSPHQLATLPPIRSSASSHTHRHTLSYVNLCTANTRTLAHTLRHTHAWTYSKRACTHKQCALPALSHTHSACTEMQCIYPHTYNHIPDYTCADIHTLTSG